MKEENEKKITKQLLRMYTPNTRDTQTTTQQICF